MFNIHTLTWDAEILDKLRIPSCMLPEVRDSSGDFGVTDEHILGGEIPIGALVGDQQGSLFGQCCFQPGNGQKHIRNRMLSTDEYRRSSGDV